MGGKSKKDSKFVAEFLFLNLQLQMEKAQELSNENEVDVSATIKDLEKKLENAIADFTEAIRIDPNYAQAYRNRGSSKEKEGLSYCSDYQRACDLGLKTCCKWYDEKCKSKRFDNNTASSDFEKHGNQGDLFVPID